MFLLVLAHPGSPGQRAIKRLCVCLLSSGIYHTHSFNGPFSGTTRVSRYQKGKTNLDFTGARDSEWQWHQLGTMNKIAY